MGRYTHRVAIANHRGSSLRTCPRCHDGRMLTVEHLACIRTVSPITIHHDPPTPDVQLRSSFLPSYAGLAPCGTCARSSPVGELAAGNALTLEADARSTDRSAFGDPGDVARWCLLGSGEKRSDGRDNDNHLRERSSGVSPRRMEHRKLVLGPAAQYYSQIDRLRAWP